MRYIIFIAILVYWLVRAYSSRDAQSSRTRRRDDPNRNMRLKIAREMMEDDDGEELPVWKISMTGAVAVPRARYPVRILVRVGDATDAKNLMPIYCHIGACADEDGMYRVSIDHEIPHEVTAFEDIEIATVPLFALVAPYRGERKLTVLVDILDAKNEDRCFQSASTVRKFEQVQHGYMEIDQRSEEQEKLAGQLALAFGASDGAIDATETAVIKRYLSERHTAREADTAAKKRLSAHLRETRDALSSGELNAAELMKELCTKILKYEDLSYNQSAYELCVQVVAADEVIDDAESAALSVLAETLEIPAELAKETHDRNFRISMYGRRTEESLLDMPVGLSAEEKIVFLGREYKKWRARATHESEDVQLEATRRLEVITKLRRRLSDD